MPGISNNEVEFIVHFVIRYSWHSWHSPKPIVFDQVRDHELVLPGESHEPKSRVPESRIDVRLAPDTAGSHLPNRCFEQARGEVHTQVELGVGGERRFADQHHPHRCDVHQMAHQIAGRAIEYPQIVDEMASLERAVYSHGLPAG